MSVRKRSNIWLADLVGLAVLLGAAWLAVVYWVEPNRAQAGRQRVVRHQAAKLQATVAQQATRRTALTQRRDQCARALNARYMCLPAIKDLSTYITGMSQAAEDAGIWLEELSPGAIETAGHFATTTVRLTAEGSFWSFIRWLELVDKTMPYLDVTKLAIRSGPNAEAGNIRLRWSAHILMRTADRGPMAIAPAPSQHTDASRESHE